MSKLAFILIYDNDTESKKILKVIKDSEVKGITEILVNDETRELLLDNTKGVIVKNFPSFLVAQEGETTQVYPGKDVNKIILMIKNLE